MDLTPNFGLGKPLTTEQYSVDVPNNNMDIIDSEIQIVKNDLVTTNNNVATVTANDARGLVGFEKSTAPATFPIKGKRIALIAFTADVNTDASGFYTYTHNLGWIPRVVFAITTNPGSNFGVVHGIDSLTSTQMRVRFMTAAANGGPLVSAIVPDVTFLFIEV